MHRWPKSTGAQYMSGHPPTMQASPRASHSRIAASETLPWPKDRWNQRRETPRSLHWLTSSTETSGWVATMTPSTADDVGRLPRVSGYARYGDALPPEELGNEPGYVDHRTSSRSEL